MTESEYEYSRAALQEIARFVQTFAGRVELLSFMRDADAQLALTSPLEQRLRLASDYALASALSAYLLSVKGLES